MRHSDDDRPLTFGAYPLSMAGKILVSSDIF